MNKTEVSQPTKRLPYHNLILAGFIGMGKVELGRGIAKKAGTDFIDLEAELQQREGLSVAQIRDQFGEGRLRTLENALCRELALQRSAVIAVSSSTLLDAENRERLLGLSGGILVVLTCTLDEILRRLYRVQGASFHDSKARSAALAQVRRERQISQIGEALGGLPTLDTTDFDPAQTIANTIAYWFSQETVFV
jgi:shikimate kinase